MAGIAAFFGKDPTALSDLSEGLSARGHDTVQWREGRVGLAARAAIPMVHTRGGLAAVVDGVAEISRMLDEYAVRGGDALIRAGEPYVIALADPKRNRLALARSGEGPALYYAVEGVLVDPQPKTGTRAVDGFRAWRNTGGGSVLVAAEPAALIAAGVSADPDPEVVRRFVDTGRCDDSEATFFPAIRRLLPGQVVEVTLEGVRVTTYQPEPRPVVTLSQAVGEAARHGRLGLHLSDTTDGAELLAAVLSDPSVARPVPAYQPVFVDPRAADAEQSDALVDESGASGAVRRVPVPLSAARLVADLPAYLTDLGEPVPDLRSYQLWTSARAGMGEVDTLLDSGVDRHAGHRSRVADRIAARYGVCVRYPYAAAAARGVSADDPALLTEVLNQVKDRVYHAFLSEAFASRPWANPNAVVGAFDAFLAGRGIHDPGRFWRLYLVEEWLRVLGRSEADPAAPPTTPFAAHPGRQLDATVEGQRWLRIPVRTGRFTAGDDVGRKVAGYVAELVAAAREERPYRDVFVHPWYVATADKAVAVAQGRAHLLWQIRPGRLARGLARVASRHPYRPGQRNAWTLELAIREAGAWRVVAAVLAGLVGRLCGVKDWYDRVVGPAAAEIRGPRPGATYPGNLAVVRHALDADRVAAEVAAALRSTLPSDAARSLAGSVVLGVRDDRCHVRGSWGDRTAEFYTGLFADNPWGQGNEQTPVAVVVSASAVRRPKRGKARAKRRQPAPSR